MSENIRYTDEPLGRLKVVPDFLPRPEDLVFRDEGVKVSEPGVPLATVYAMVTDRDSLQGRRPRWR
jgi:hypothetical protein